MRFIDKIKNLKHVKEFALAGVVVAGVVVYLAVSTFAEVGLFGTAGYVVSGTAVETNLSSGANDAIKMTEVKSDDVIYSRWNNIYVGDEKKVKVNTDYPMFIADGAAIRFLNGESVLYDIDFVRDATYDGLIVNYGEAYNIDGSSAALTNYIFAKLPNGLFINTDSLQFETLFLIHDIPANSILFMQEGKCAYYTVRGEYLVKGPEIGDLTATTIVRIGGVETTYGDLLKNLGVTQEETPTIQNRKKQEKETESETESEEESGIIGKDQEDSKKDAKTGGDEELAGGVQREGSAASDQAGEDGGDVGGGGSGSGASGKASSGMKGGSSSGGSSISGGEDPYAPGAIPLPAPAETAAPPSASGSEITPAKPTKGQKQPKKPSTDPPGGIPDPSWVDPKVTAGATITPGIYTLKTSVTVEDPSAAIVNGLIYEIVIMNEYGKGTLYKRVAITQKGEDEQTVLISALKPNSNYTITGTYRYKDKFGRVVQESRTFLPTTSFSTKDVTALGPIKMEDLELERASLYSNSVHIPHIRFTEESDQDAIGSTTKITVRVDEDTSHGIGDNLNTRQMNTLLSYQSLTFVTSPELESNKNYTLNIVCYDIFYNQLRVEDPNGKSSWPVKTCAQLPQAKIVANNQANNTVKLTVGITNKDNLPYSDLVLKIKKTSTGEYVKFNGSLDYREISQEELGKEFIIASPGNNDNFVLEIHCNCDNLDGKGYIDRTIGYQNLSTADIDALGAIYVTAFNITQETIDQEIASMTEAKAIAAKKKEISTRAVISLELDKTLTNPYLYDPDLGLVDLFTASIYNTTIEENWSVSLTDEELAAFLAGDKVIIDTNDTTRFPTLTGLKSDTKYQFKLYAKHFYTEDGSSSANIRVASSLGTITTATRLPEAIVNDALMAFFEKYIALDVKIQDLDEVIVGDSAILRITEKDTGVDVGSFRIEKNLNDWYKIRLSVDPKKSTGGVAYDIKADTTYQCDFIAETARSDDGYKYNHIFSSFSKTTGKALSGKIFSAGLFEKDPYDEDYYNAKIAYDVEVPEGDDVSEAFRKGEITIDEYHNYTDQSGRVKEKTGTFKIPFDENGLHPGRGYRSIEGGDDLIFTNEQIQEELKKGEKSKIKAKTVPDEYEIVDYIESDGKQYINTGVKDSDRMEINAHFWIESSKADYIYGAQQNGAWMYNGLYHDYSLEYNWKNVGHNAAHDINMTQYITGNTMNINVNGQKATAAVGTAGAGIYYIFACNNGTRVYPARTKCYGFRMRDNGVVVRDYVPVMRIKDGVYGLYDIMEGKFYGQARTGYGEFNGGGPAHRKELTYYYVDEQTKSYHQLEEYTVAPNFNRDVLKDNDDTNTYSYEMYFIYAEGTDMEQEIPLSNMEFSTDKEIYTIATGEEFITKGAKDHKYVVINDIEYNNQNVGTAPLATMRADIDFQGFSFTTYVNYAPIVDNTTRTAKISNLVLKTTSGLYSGTYNHYYWHTSFNGGMLFKTFSGTAQNLYIEFSQEEFPYLYNITSSDSYWSNMSPEEMAAIPEDDRYLYKYKIQSSIAGFAGGNTGTIENFVVDLKTEIIGNNYVGGLVMGNYAGGIIRNGYLFSSTDPLGNYKGRMTFLCGPDYNSTVYGGFGGIAAYCDTFATLDNVYVIADMKSYANTEVTRHVNGIVGNTRSASPKIRNGYFIGNSLYAYTDADGQEAYRIFDTGFGPAVGRLYSGGRDENIFFYSSEQYIEKYNNTANQKLSPYALRNVTWQNEILNTNDGFVIEKVVDVGYYPHVDYTSAVMPIQSYIPLPDARSANSSTDVVYSGEETDPSIDPKIKEIIEGDNAGDEAWDPTTSSKYYDSNDQVACIFVSEADQTKIVYSIDIEHFQLTHQDIVYQHKDGSGIISVYVHMHNPDACLSQYKINSVTYEKDSGSPGQTVSFSGRYANVEFYKQIKNPTIASGVDSWEELLKKGSYRTSTHPENMVLKNDIDFAGVSAKDIFVRGTYSGKLKGTSGTEGPFTIRNIDYDGNLGGTLGITTDTSGTGLFNLLTGSVKDVILENIHIEGGGDVGAVCAQSSGGTIDHVYVKNSYLSGGRMLGGLAGLADGSIISNSGVVDTKIVHNSGSVESSTANYGYSYYTGGAVGYSANSKIRRTFVQNAYLESMYEAFNTAIGGLVGYIYDSYTNIDGCYATGEISSNNDFTGGLIGAASHTLYSFSNCYSDMDIYAYNYCVDSCTGVINKVKGAHPASVISFGNVLQAVDFASTDERYGKIPERRCDSSISLSDYKNGGIKTILSSEYFDASVNYAAGVLPQLLDENDIPLQFQDDEYYGADYKKEPYNAGINIDSGSVKLTHQGGNSYSISLKAHHNNGIKLTKLYYSYTFADDYSGMKSQSAKIKSFTDNIVFDDSGYIIDRPDGTTTELICNSLKLKNAYDRYFITAVEYEVGNEKHVQRVGIQLDPTIIPQQWKTVNNANEWQSTIYGTHGENFRINGNIDFGASGVDINYSNNTANNVVNRLVGTIGENEDYLKYKGSSGSASGENQYWTIRNINSSDQYYSIQKDGFWQREYGKGLISVINSELGCLTFEDIKLDGKYQRFGIIFALLGNGHQMNFNNIEMNSTSSYMSIIPHLKDGIDKVYMNNCDTTTSSTYCSGLVAYMHPYTHNNHLKEIYAENCDIKTTNTTTNEVGMGVIEGSTYRSWNIPCNSGDGFAAAPHYDKLDVYKCNVESNGTLTGVIAGRITGTMTNCSAIDCNVLGGSYTGVITGQGVYATITGATADNCTSKAYSNFGGIAGRMDPNNGVTSIYACYINNSTLKNSKVLYRTKTINDSDAYYVGGICGCFSNSNAGIGFSGDVVQDCEIEGKSCYVGGMSGFSYHVRCANNTVTNTSVKGTVDVGGILGYVQTGYQTNMEYNTVKDCSIISNISSGGIFGSGSGAYVGNKIYDSTIVAIERNAGGFAGVTESYRNNGNSSYYTSVDNGQYGANVKNCRIYAASMVGGGIGYILYDNTGCMIIENCDIRGYGRVGGIFGNGSYTGGIDTSGQIFREAFHTWVKDCFIGEIDENTLVSVRENFGITIDDIATHAYFGGGGGYGNTLYSCMIEDSIIYAPNSDYVGALQGSLRATYYNEEYGTTGSAISKNCVVEGRDYVSGLFGEIMALFNEKQYDQSYRISGKYSYSNAMVKGKDHVSGIASRYLYENTGRGGEEQSDGDAFNPKLSNVYFTGSLEATDGLVAGVLTDQSINPKDRFQLDGVISMPSLMKGNRIYPIVNNECSDGFDKLAAQNAYQFVTLWDNTAIQYNDGTAATTMGTLMANEPYKSYSFHLSDDGGNAYGMVIDASTKKRTTDNRFIMMLDTAYDKADIYSKALRSSTYFAYDAEFGNIKDGLDYMPLVKDYLSTSRKIFGAYKLSLGDGYSMRQGVKFPGQNSSEIAKQQQKIDDYLSGSEWGGGPTDAQAKIEKYLSVYASGIDKVNIEAKPGFYSALGATPNNASYTTEVVKHDYLTTLKSYEQATAVPIVESSAQSYGYNFMDDLVINVSYTISGETKTATIVKHPEKLRRTKDNTNYYISNGNVYKRATSAGQEDTLILDKSNISIDSSLLPSGYTLLNYIDMGGNQRIETGVPCRDSEIYFDFTPNKIVSNMYMFGDTTLPSHQYMIMLYNNSDFTARGFGYLGGNIGSNIQTGIGGGESNPRYTLYVSGKTGNLGIALKNHKDGTAYKTLYTNTNWNAYVYDKSSGMTLASGENKAGLSGRIYGVLIYSNGFLVRDYIPCKENGAGGKAGLYDLVNKKFYPSSTATPFVAGDTVTTTDHGTKEYIHFFKNSGDGQYYALDGYGNKRKIE